MARELPAEFDALEPDLVRVDQTGLQRNVGAKIVENFVGPGRG